MNHEDYTPEEVADAIAERAKTNRQPYGGLTNDEIDAVAERAAEKVIERLYVNVGKNVLRKAAWLIGVLIISAAIWMAGNGTLKT